MTLHLILMRHAEAGAAPRLGDRDRPLTGRGRRAAALMGAWMREEGLTPARALVSPARRTRETWAHTGLTAPEEIRPVLYAAGAEAILEEIALTTDAPSPLFLLGHNPGIWEAANRLLSQDAVESFPPAQAVAIGFEAAYWNETRVSTGRMLTLRSPQDRR